MVSKFSILFAAALVCVGCSRNGAHSGAVISAEPFGVTAEGDSATLYTLTNPSGAYVQLTDYGCRVVSINVPDGDGTLGDLAVCYDNLYDFEHGDRFLGCVLGRYANRVAGDSVIIDGKAYQLSNNETLDGKPGHLHGGFSGFDRKMWRGETLQQGDTVGVRFSYLSPDGEEGYPGNLQTYVTYQWTPDNELIISYQAETDSPTIVCLSNHTFFNLGGHDCGRSVLDHLVYIDSDSSAVNSKQFVPKRIESLDGSPLDFRSPATFSSHDGNPNEHMRTMGGFSACWKLNGYDGSMRHAATLCDTVSRRAVDVYTTEPCLLIYTGFWYDGTDSIKGHPFTKCNGLLLETIHLPDSPHHPEWPSVTLFPGQVYQSSTKYHFTTRK